MKHCAKKLLGLAFALALCLAVGGTALAETPEFAEAPDTLPEQEMLAYEPNVTAEPGTNTTGNLATEGYQVTIPTTVEVKSGEDTSELKITAEMKQWRTLEIDIASNNSWKLAYDGAAGANAPQVDYTLKNTVGGGHTSQGMIWTYDATNHKIAYTTTRLTAVDKAEIPLSVNVTDPSQATMSGTYSDTLAFDFKITKQSVTYTINVYGQNITAQANGRANVESVVTPGTTTNESTRTEGTVDESKVKDYTYTETYTLEYGFANDKLVGEAPGSWTHTQPEAGDTRTSIKNTVKTFTDESAADYKRCWETLSPQTIDPQTDYTNGIRNVTINLNLMRKWYWLDVNGIIDYNGSDTHKTHGNQEGEKIGCHLDVQISPDGKDWSSQWYWYGADGDDYWERLPYGTYVQIGFHHLKDGYIYDTDTDGNIKVIANGVPGYTDGELPSGTVGKTYRPFKGQLIGEPLETDLFGSNSKRYCFNVCYHKAITYYANDGTDTKKSIQYEADKPLLRKQEVDDSWTGVPGANFVGWSTKQTISSDSEILHPNDIPVSTITWPAGNTRTLYAQWQHSYTVKLSFESQGGWTNRNPDGTFGTEESYTKNYPNTVVLAGTVSACPGQKLTFSADATDEYCKTMWNNIQRQITEQTTAAAGASGKADKEIWQLSDAYTVTMPTGTTREVVINIKRQRYLVNIIAVLVDDTGNIAEEASKDNATKYGRFKVFVNGLNQTASAKVPIYQYKRNFGSPYRVEAVEANAGYTFYGFRTVNADGSTTDTLAKGGNNQCGGTLTGKSNDITYFGLVSGSDPNQYTGDTIYVMFQNENGRNITLHANDGTGKTVQYNISGRFPLLTDTGFTAPAGKTLVGWSATPTYTGAEGEMRYQPGGDIGDFNGTELYAVWSSTGPNRAPARKALTLRYHANFDPNEELALDLDPDPLLDDLDDTFGFDPDPLLEDVDDALEGAVKTVSYQPGEDVVLRNCMFKRSGYVFVGWNTEPDGTGRLYRVNGVPITDWAAGDTVDLYAQWKKPDHLKPVVDNEPFVPTDPDTPPEELDPGFGIDPDADPADEEGPADDADAVDDAPAVADEEAAAAPPEELDFGFGIDPDAAVGGPAPFVRW